MKIISDLTPWLLIPLQLVCVSLSVFLFKKQAWLRDAPRWVKPTVISLRSISLFLVIVLILGVLIERKEIEYQSPSLIVVVDNSQSMINYPDSGFVQKRIKEIQKKIKDENASSMKISYLTIGTSLNTSSSYDFKDSKSNLSEAFDKIQTRYFNKNIGGIVFISDGNYTNGVNPLNFIENNPFVPIFTVGVGDTVLKTDQLITHVSVNEFANLNSLFPVEIMIESRKMKNKNSTLNIFKSGKKISSYPIHFKSEKAFIKQSIELNASELGLHEYTASLSSDPTEYTSKNNAYSFYIEVLESRSKKLILTGAPHPDVSVLKTILQKEENSEVEIGYLPEWKGRVSNYDIVLWYEPGVGFQESLLEQLKTSNTPVFYIVGTRTTPSIIDKLGIGVDLQTSTEQNEIQADVNNSNTSIELTDNQEKLIESFPPLLVNYGDVISNNTNEIVLYQKIGGYKTTNPLLLVGSNKGKAHGFLYGEGIWKWKLNEYGAMKNNTVLEAIIQKTVSFLARKENTSPLKIEFPSVLSTEEDVLISATFRNEKNELTTQSIIHFEYWNKDHVKKQKTFNPEGTQFSLSLGKLNEGLYNWKASTTFNGKRHSKSGIFIIKTPHIEQAETRANHGLLKQMAKESNGSFSPLSKASGLPILISKRNDIRTIGTEKPITHNLLEYALVLLLIIGTLSSEWFIKKWFGSY